ncbi:MAG: universal stress protein [Gemmatimonadaceae bacterium]
MRLPHRSRLQRLLVASDGEPAGDAALRLAKLLANRDGADVEVVGVFSPRIPVPPIAPDSCEHQCEFHDRPAAAQLIRRIRRQTRDRIGASWPVRLRIGHAASIICDTARAFGANLVLIGHTTPEPGERRAGRHTAEQIALGCDIPVLTVPSGVNSLPRIAVAVIDESGGAEAAVSMATTLLGSDGALHEARGPVTREVLHLSEALGADLLSLPLAGHNATVRSLMAGGVADVLDHARCSVLVTPSVGNETRIVGAHASQHPRPRGA